jgi:hypothetical protein
MPDGINETLRSALEPLARLPIARLLDALKVLDFEPIPLVKGATTPAPIKVQACILKPPLPSKPPTESESVGRPGRERVREKKVNDRDSVDLAQLLQMNLIVG